MSDINQKTVNAIRILAADAIQKANSGHPGLPLGAAPMAYELWANHLKFNPKNPKWINRDRFILSAGHGSAMLYALNHLFGCGLTIDDINKKGGNNPNKHLAYMALANSATDVWKEFDIDKR